MKSISIMSVLAAVACARRIVNTIVIVPNTPSGGFQLINIPPCA